MQSKQHLSFDTIVVVVHIDATILWTHRTALMLIVRDDPYWIRDDDRMKNFLHVYKLRIVVKGRKAWKIRQIRIASIEW
jgi:hypothetical protein